MNPDNEQQQQMNEAKYIEIEQKQEICEMWSKFETNVQQSEFLFSFFSLSTVGICSLTLAVMSSDSNS